MLPCCLILFDIIVSYAVYTSHTQMVVYTIYNANDFQLVSTWFYLHDIIFLLITQQTWLAATKVIANVRQLAVKRKSTDRQQLREANSVKHSDFCRSLSRLQFKAEFLKMFSQHKIIVKRYNKQQNGQFEMILTSYFSRDSAILKTKLREMFLSVLTMFRV